MDPLAGRLVVELARNLPGPFAGRELLRLGARVVRVEAPEGDPMRASAAAWEAALNGGKESVVCDLKRDVRLANALCARADIVLDGFRPGVLDRLGVVVPATAVRCSITGFGSAGPEAAARAGHDLNYMGYAGALAETGRNLPPVQVADLAGGALNAVIAILAALLHGGGARLEISMTHGAHGLVSHRSGGDPTPGFLTGGVPCYAIYETADGRRLTVAALEPRFWKRLCELLERADLEERQFDPSIAGELQTIFGGRPLADWLELCRGEDVCVGPVLTLDEAAADLGGGEPTTRSPLPGEHTEAWEHELGL